MEPCGLTNVGINMMFCEGDYANRALVSNNFVALTSAGNHNVWNLPHITLNNVDYYHNSINITGIN